MRPLVPVRFRMPTLVVALLCWLVAVMLGLFYAGARYAGNLDNSITGAVHASVGHRLAEALVAPTDAPVVYGLVGVVVVVALLRRLVAVAVLAVVGPAITVLITEFVLKPGFGRTHGGFLSYPSGHAASTVAALTVAVLLFTAGVSRALRLLAAALWLALTTIIAIGLVAMNYHYPTDTVGGACVALGVVLPAAVLADLWTARLHGIDRLSPRPISPARR